MGLPQTGWFIRENPAKMNNKNGCLVSGNFHICTYIYIIYIYIYTFNIEHLQPNLASETR